MYLDKDTAMAYMQRAEEEGHVNYNQGWPLEENPYQYPYCEAWKRGWLDEEEADARQQSELYMLDAC